MIYIYILYLYINILIYLFIYLFVYLFIYCCEDIWTHVCYYGLSGWSSQVETARVRSIQRNKPSRHWEQSSNLVQHERNMTNVSGPRTYDNKIQEAMEQQHPTNCRAAKVHRDLQLWTAHGEGWGDTAPRPFHWSNPPGDAIDGHGAMGAIPTTGHGPTALLAPDTSPRTSTASWPWLRSCHESWQDDLAPVGSRSSCGHHIIYTVSVMHRANMNPPSKRIS